MRCRDGAMVISAYIEKHWNAFCKTIGDEALLTDPRFIDGAGRVANRAALTERIEARLADKSAAEWQPIFQAAGLVTGELKDYAKVVTDPCALASGIIAPMETGFGIRNPVTMGGVQKPRAKNREEFRPSELEFMSRDEQRPSRPTAGGSDDTYSPHANALDHP
jgi:crotonobetainyl-CoA:carnitine CoA-transferase CaiB-like acyl-CoA transferase